MRWSTLTNGSKSLGHSATVCSVAHITIEIDGIRLCSEETRPSVSIWSKRILCFPSCSTIYGNSQSYVFSDSMENLLEQILKFLHRKKPLNETTQNSTNQPTKKGSKTKDCWYSVRDRILPLDSFTQLQPLQFSLNTDYKPLQTKQKSWVMQ